MLIQLIVLAALGSVDCLPPSSPRIVNGTDAVDGEFPYMVSLRQVRDGEQHVCCGSIISDRWILTAGHCVWNEPHPSVRFGSIYLDEGHVDYNLTMPVKNQIVHPDYTNVANDSGWFLLYDAALIELNGSLPFGVNVRPVKLPEQDDPEPLGETGLLSGWGDVDDARTKPVILQKTDQTLYAQDFCSEYFDDDTGWYYDVIQYVCAGAPLGLRRACYGDSGAPLVVDGVQRGIVSWGTAGCAPSPTVFTRVAFVRDWIRQVTGV